MKPIAFAALLLLASPATAYETVTLYSKGAWSTIVEMYDTGEMACAMTTVQRGGRLDLTHYRSRGGLEIYLNFDGVQGGAYVVDLELEVDDWGPWNLYKARGQGSAIFFELPDEDASSRLVAEIALGKMLYLYDGPEIYHHWSLSGSAAALNALIDCVRKL